VGLAVHVLHAGDQRLHHVIFDCHHATSLA
jgi:hypothetical protein